MMINNNQNDNNFHDHDHHQKSNRLPKIYSPDQLD